MNANHVKRNLPYIIMAIPAVSIFSVFFIIPLIFTTKYSFYNWTNFSPDIVFSGLKNYKQLLADGIILKGLKNTLVFAIYYQSWYNMIAFVRISAMVYSFPSCWRRGDFLLNVKDLVFLRGPHIMIHIKIDAL